MKIRYLLLFSIAGAIIAVDQMTKLLIVTRFHLSESIPVIKNFFDLTYVRNYGAAFGIMSEMPEGIRETFFMIVPLVAAVVILYMIRSTSDQDRYTVGALSLIFGGAIGNFIDRIRFGYVVDFLDFYFGTYHWPAFNVADSAIVVGVTLTMIQTLFHKQRA